MKNEFNWNDDYSVSVGVIDTQHQMLFQYINELYEAINKENEHEVSMECMHKLKDYTKFHFHEEEAL